MTLGERIRCYRGRRGLSQEALAEQVGVSRQAVSKWETDAAVPELDKLVALARAFGVTTDQLLTEEIPAEEVPPVREAPPPVEDRLDHAAGWLGRQIRRWGWLYGIYVMAGGLGAVLIGTLAYAGFRSMLSPVIDPFGDGSLMFSMEPSFTFPMTFAKAIIGIGVVMVIAGAVLTVYLRRRR